MKYFMDFEATQFDQEIISVGCVDENGREFYSLVRPHSVKRLTGFITELTGITASNLKKAPDADTVFSRLYDFVDKNERADFYCYGNCDGRFIKVTLEYVKSLQAECMLGLMLCSLTDVSVEMSSLFKTNQAISLYKLADRYGATDERNHHALNDAKLLKHVYEHTRNEKITQCPFPEYIQTTKRNRAETVRRIPAHARLAASRGADVRYFSSYGLAADWLMNDLMTRGGTVTSYTKSNISNRIVKASSSGRPYYGYVWSRVAGEKDSPEQDDQKSKKIIKSS